MRTITRYLDNYFEITKHGSSISRELIAGLTTFSTLSYIMIVNPQILSVTGMDKNSLITATALSAIIGTLIMGLWANLPVALAAGMGSNIIFSYVVVGQVGASWQTALGMVFLTGVLFLLLSISQWREKIVDGFPNEIQLGLQCAIGVFIAYLGLKSGGLVVASESSLIAVGDLSNPATLLTFVGLLLTPVLMAKKIPGAFLLSIIILTFCGLFIDNFNGTPLTQLPETILDTPKLSSEILFAFDFNEIFDKFFLLMPIAIYFFMSDFFSTAATLIGVTRRGNLLTPDGKIPNAKQAFTADAIATVSGATLGTSTVTSYIESVAGIEAGGRTGLTSITVALMFFLAIFFWPLISIIPVQATAPTLVLVGVLMLEGVTDIKTDSLENSLTPLLTLLMTACTADLMIGLSSGCFSYTLIVVARKDWKNLSPMLLLLDITLIIYLALFTTLF